MDKINTLQSTANTAVKSALDFSAAGGDLPAKLREAISGRFANSPIIAQRDKALKTALDEPTDTRAFLADTVRNGTILSPTQQQQIAAGRRTNATIPLISANDLLQRETGGIDTLVNAGTTAYKAKADALNAGAKIAQDQADSAFERFIKESQLDLERKKAGISGTGSTDDATLGWLTQIKNGSIKNLNQIPAAERNKVVSAMSKLGINPYQIQKGLEGNQVKNTLSSLYELYGDPSGSSSLAGGPLKGFLTNLQIGLHQNPTAKTYADTKDAILGNLKQITGDTGILTDQDAARISKLLPDFYTSSKEAKAKWDQINTLLTNKYGVGIYDAGTSDGFIAD